MKLILRKDQERKLMGGVKFILNARVELTPEEEELVNRFNAEKEVLVEREVNVPLRKEPLSMSVQLGTLMGKGITFNCGSFCEILEYEEGLKEGCDRFFMFFELMKRFGGEEVFDFPRSIEEQKKKK